VGLNFEAVTAPAYKRGNRCHVSFFLAPVQILNLYTWPEDGNKQFRDEVNMNIQISPINKSSIIRQVKEVLQLVSCNLCFTTFVSITSLVALMK
jgi:hypothetical protein